jgi:hypothetical protein
MPKSYYLEMNDKIVHAHEFLADPAFVLTIAIPWPNPRLPGRSAGATSCLGEALQ